MINQKVARLRRLAGEGSWVVLGQVVTVAAGLALVRVLTHFLDPAHYGELALGLTASVLVNQTVLGGINVGIGRYYSVASERNSLGVYFRDARRLLAWGLLATMTVGVLLVGTLVCLGLLRWASLAGAALVLSMASGINSCLSSVQNAARQRAIVAFHGGLDACLRAFLALIALTWFGASSIAVMLVYAASSLVVTGSQFLFLRRTLVNAEATLHQGESLFGDMLAFSWPFATWGLFTWLQQVSDRWSLEAFSGSSEVGQYAVLFQLGYAPVSMLTGMVTTFLGPILFGRAGGGRDRARNESVHKLSWLIAWASLSLTLLGVLAALLLHDALFSVLVAERYRSSSHMLPYFVLAGGLFATGQVLALKLMSEMKSGRMVSVKVTTSLAGIAANVVGAWTLGLTGVASGLVVFSSLYLLWMMRIASNVGESSVDTTG